MVAESRTVNAAGKGGGPSESRRGSEVPKKPGNAGGGKDPVSPPLWGTQPCFWCVCEEEKTRRLMKVWKRRIKYGNFRSNCIERRRANRTSASICFTTRSIGQTFCRGRGCWRKPTMARREWITKASKTSSRKERWSGWTGSAKNCTTKHIDHSR